MIFNKKDHTIESLLTLPWVIPVGLAFICLLSYLNSFNNNFLLDDHLVLFGQRGVINRSIWEILLQDQGGFYRPGGYLPLWLFTHFLGHNQLGYHIINVILLFFIVYLLYLIIKNLTSDRRLACLTALLYATHPINGFLVNYMTASYISIFVLSMQLSFLFFIRFSDQENYKDYVLSFFFFVYACLSHEMSIMLPAFLIVYLFFMKRDRLGRLSQWVWPFIIFLVIWFVVRSCMATVHHISNPSLALVNIQAYLSTWLDLVGWYVSKLVFPKDILFLWSSQYGVKNFLLQGLVFLSLSIAFIHTLVRWNKGYKPLMLVMFVVGLLPSLYSSFIYFPLVWPMIEPHWFYFSSIGFFVLLALFLNFIISKNSKVGVVLTGFVVVCFVGLNWDLNSKWFKQETYCSYWLSLNPGNLTPYYGLGRSLMDQGDYVSAAKIFDVGYNRLHMLSLELTADMGHCMDVLGDDQKASDYLNTALKMDPNYALTYHYIGLYFYKRNKPERAQDYFRKAIALDPKFSPSYAYLNQ